MKGVIISSGTTIGNNVKIGSYSCIGGSGFQYQRQIKNKSQILSVKHVGGTKIGDNVEMKEYCSVHRAVFSWDHTIVDKNTKIDSHCHIGHAAKVGESVFLCSHANLSGNNKIGRLFLYRTRS